MSSDPSSGSVSRALGGSSNRYTAQVESNMGVILPSLMMRDLEVQKKGTRGEERAVIANYVRIEKHIDSLVFQYHVNFKPVVDSKRSREIIVAQIGLQTNGTLFDGAMLYSAEPIKIETAIGEHPVTKDRVDVYVKQTQQFAYNSPQAIHVYDLLIRRAMNLSGLICIARHFFNPQGSQSVEKFKLELWPGYHTATRLYEDGLMVCIENRWKVLRADTALDHMNEILSRNRNKADEAFFAECDRVFIGQTVIMLYNNKMHRITGVDREVTAGSTFQMADGSEISFVQYYKQQYNIDNVDPHQPMLVSEGKPKQPGEPRQKTYLIPEQAHLTGISDEMRSNQACMKAISNVTRLTPQRRNEVTEAWLSQVETNDRIQEMFHAWNFNLGTSLVKFTARQLPPEMCFGAKPSGYYGEKAEWARCVKSNGNFKSAAMVNWVLVAPGTQQAIDVANKMIEECGRIASQLGMKYTTPYCASVDSFEPAAYLREIQNSLRLASESGVEVPVVVVLLKDDNKTRYDAVKKLCCLESPVPTQCVLLKTLLGRPQDRGENRQFGSICLKIMLQINCKMGGAPWKIGIPLKDTMIMGYDLYSDSTTRGKCAGACVSSYDENFTQWHSQCRPHENPTELGKNLFFFVQRALRMYYLNNNEKLPVRIILYRDGVGDGQIPHVKDEEVSQVEKACKEVEKVCKGQPSIKIAFILVTKKVNTRILLNAGIPQNPMPGTVVDDIITRPERLDFYLVPQAVNQGTVTPVHYSILHDTTGLDIDKHQTLAFKLSHLYYNWQGTVRVPAPCQYAHKLAFLFTQSLHKEAHEQLRSKLFYL